MLVSGQNRFGEFLGGSGDLPAYFNYFFNKASSEKCVTFDLLYFTVQSPLR